MSDEIKDALLTLDIDDDSHWTSDGLPRLDVMKELVGNDVTRADIVKVAKDFHRKNAIIEDQGIIINETINSNDDDIVIDDEQLLRNDYNNALKCLNEANGKFLIAQKNLDSYIEKNELENKQSLADQIKQFQASQRNQRETNAGVAKALAEAVKATKARV